MNLHHELRKVESIVQYSKILDEYGGSDKLADDLLYIFETMPQIFELGDAVFKKEHTAENIGEATDYTYYIMKALANTANFASVMMPICRRYFPTDEDKTKFVEFIKKMEEDNNDD